MKSPLDILHLEDDPNDAALVKASLEAGGIACRITRVQTRNDFVAALENGVFDLILSDFTLPAFDGISAAKIVQNRWPDIPLILVSGTLGEEQAIDSLKSGATDYVLKNRLSRLVPAVRRAMKEVEEHAARRLMEAQFIEAQKMEVVGHLAGGVAHDFNNILTIIMGYIHLLRVEVGARVRAQEYLDEIAHSIHHAEGLTRQLLVFSRKQTGRPVILDLNTVVGDLEKMLRRLIGENIEMKFVAGKQIGFIKADSGYIGQVLMNLIVNARDAMPNGGRIVIETSHVTLDAKQGSAPDGPAPGDYALMSVSDTGSGILNEVKEHLFEAFFTTKPKDKGTGLGLATCRTIMQQCGGHIVVESEAGKGTSFHLYFPIIDREPEAESMTSQTAPLPRGTETLLFVEDEPSLRHLACGVLEGQGYSVLPAANGQEALNVARSHAGEPIRLAVTDVIMPVMGGKVMAEWLKAAYPEIKILYTSGYIDGSIMPRGGFDAEVAFLPKPYTLEQLIQKVRETLDS